MIFQNVKTKKILRSNEDHLILLILTPINLIRFVAYHAFNETLISKIVIKLFIKYQNVFVNEGLAETIAHT